MDRVEKTVFISYRRANVPWVLAINQYLMHSGYDVFFDFQNIASGDFEQIITENIQARAHFLILLTPSALDRCNEPNDWFRWEIEIALDCKRNIVPVMLEGFDFGDKKTVDYLTGELERVQHLNGLRIHADYFDAGMERLCKQFLDISLDRVKHPELPKVSSKTQQVVEEQKRVVAEQNPVDEKVLSAQGWFEWAYKAVEPEEKIRLYTKAIELDPNFAYAYNNRGYSYDDLKEYRKAIIDFNNALEIEPAYSIAYCNRGVSYVNLKEYEKAVADFNKAIDLDSENAYIYYNRGVSYTNLKKYEKAIADFNKVIELDPKNDIAYDNRGLNYMNLKKYKEAIADYTQAIKINPEDASAYYNRACTYALCEKVEDALVNLRRALEIDPQKYSDLTRNDSDFDKIRENIDFQNLLKEFCDQC